MSFIKIPLSYAENKIIIISILSVLVVTHGFTCVKVKCSVAMNVSKQHFETKNKPLTNGSKSRTLKQ